LVQEESGRLWWWQGIVNGTITLKLPHFSWWHMWLEGIPMATVQTGNDSCEDSDDVVYPPDNRLNWQYGDWAVVVYPNDSGGIDIYDVVSGEGVFIAHITEDTELPIETEHVSLYATLEGYVLVIMDAEGKTFWFFSNDLTFSEYIVNEV
jgi:hypothetical protein